MLRLVITCMLQDTTGVGVLRRESLGKKIPIDI
jgi:hypothetical protein